MNALLRAQLVFSSSIVLPRIFCPFKPIILVTSTLFHLLENIISVALIAPIKIVCMTSPIWFYPISTSSGTLLIVTRFRIRDDTIGRVILMYIYATDCYKYGSIRRVYRRTSKKATLFLFLSLISPITLCFNSSLFCVTSDTNCWNTVQWLSYIPETCASERYQHWGRMTGFVVL